jgi:hypothetical protein
MKKNFIKLFRGMQGRETCARRPEKHAPDSARWGGGGGGGGVFLQRVGHIADSTKVAKVLFWEMVTSFGLLDPSF